MYTYFSFVMPNNVDLNVIDCHWDFTPVCIHTEDKFKASDTLHCVSLIDYRVEIYQCYRLDF